MQITEKDNNRYMLTAIQLAKKGLGKTSPNPAVGCVIVKDKKIVGAGFHKRFGAAHAEIAALNKAGSKARGASLYVNLEPCIHFGKTPPCVDAIIKSGVKTVFVGMRDPNPVNNGKGIRRLRSAGIKVKTGVCNKEAKDLNASFIKYIKGGFPYVTLKMAQSLDGKIAAKTGDSKWITCKDSRRLVHQIRQQVDAVMVGVGTVIRDDPLLTSRISYLASRISPKQPVKIIVDSKLRTPLNSRIFSKKSSAKTIIATTNSASKKRMRQFLKENVEVLPVGPKNGKVNLRALMKLLANKGLINIVVEGGAELAASLLNEGLVDRVLFFVAPKIIGNKNKISQALAVKSLTVKKIASDFLFEGSL